MWLVSNLKEDSPNNHEETNYGIIIDADANENTGWQGVDYQAENSRKNGGWNRTFYEYSSVGDSRILNTQKNYSSFYEKNGKYVNLYADLNKMGSPNKYRVMFYAEEKGKSIWKTDFSSWVDIPQPQVSLLTTPGHVVLRPGEESTRQKATRFSTYIQTHSTPLCRVVPLEILQKGESSKNSAMNYDKEK